MDQSDFEPLWTAAAPRVRVFLAAACCDTAAVDDLMQEVAMTAWRKRSQFDKDRRFEAWIIGVARFALLRHRRDAARQKIILAPDLIERLETIAAAESESLDDRRQAFAACVRALGESARTLLKLRYESRTPLAEVARQLGRSHGAIRTSLTRVRDSLRRCIEDRLSVVHRRDDVDEERI